MIHSTQAPNEGTSPERWNQNIKQEREGKVYDAKTRGENILPKKKVSHGHSFQSPSTCWANDNCFSHFICEALTMMCIHEELTKTRADNITMFRPPLPIPDTLADEYAAMPSRKNCLEAIMYQLTSMYTWKRVIGVYGEEGAGKTTLINKLAVEIDSLKIYTAVVMMSGHQLNQKGLLYFQDLIADIIGFTLSDCDTLHERVRRVHEMLSSIGKVLIIIDDVESTIDLTEIGIPWPDSNNGVRLVVVSSSLNVLHNMKTQMNLELKPLPQDESWDLFTELVKEYDLQSASHTFQIAKDCIASKATWLPGEIRDVLFDLYCKPAVPTYQSSTFRNTHNARSTLKK